MHSQLAVVHLGESEQILDEFLQALCLAVGNVYVFFLHLRRQDYLAGQQLQISNDRG